MNSQKSLPDSCDKDQDISLGVSVGSSRDFTLKETNSYYGIDLNADEAKITKVIASNLQALRQRYGLTQNELAKRIAFSNRTVSAVECGTTIPSALFLYRLCNYFHVSADSILSPDGANKDLQIEVGKGSYSPFQTKLPFAATDVEKKLIVYLHFLGEDNRKIVLSNLQKFFKDNI